ncbi:hypothetical protein ACJX0J_036233 [Zea mays]
MQTLKYLVIWVPMPNTNVFSIHKEQERGSESSASDMIGKWAIDSWATTLDSQVITCHFSPGEHPLEDSYTLNRATCNSYVVRDNSIWENKNIQNHRMGVIQRMAEGQELMKEIHSGITCEIAKGLLGASVINGLKLEAIKQLKQWRNRKLRLYSPTWQDFKTLKIQIDINFT